ncbi:ribosome biogenesis GTPase YlqF [Chryseomicrobium aureum]|uniref:ribosome biogenesis GTPase YlqF n=1 Tax=Chryseomicrobium aureum TaxID=1441723 RepID=UPI00370D7A54
MTIQWFPGHMAKARREVTENLKLVDIVFELVDARLPVSSRNPMLEQIVHQKTKLMILTKADMADERETAKWIEYYATQGIQAVAINSFEGKDLQKVLKETRVLLKPKFDRMKSRGMKPRAIRAMILGIPNVGKSTLINRFAKKNIARTGNTPGVTKSQQWIKIAKELELLDTPGILWPKFEDQQIGFKLALSGAIKDAVLRMEDLAVYALRFLEAHYPERLQERFQLETVGDDLEQVFNHIGQLRKVYATGGEVDYDAVAELIVRDVRNEHLGRLTFDFVEDEAPLE